MTAWPRWGFFDGQEDGIYHPSDPELRIKDQDIDGVDAEVVYGILGIGGGGFSGPGFRNFEVTTAIYDVYNEWVANLFRPYSSPDSGPRVPKQPRSRGRRPTTQGLRRPGPPRRRDQCRQDAGPRLPQGLGAPVAGRIGHPNAHFLPHFGISPPHPRPRRPGRVRPARHGPAIHYVPAIRHRVPGEHGAFGRLRTPPRLPVRARRVRHRLDPLRNRKDRYQVR